MAGKKSPKVDRPKLGSVIPDMGGMLPSEKAAVCKQLYEELQQGKYQVEEPVTRKHGRKRVELPEEDAGLWLDEALAMRVNMSRNQMYRMLRLAECSPEIQRLVDKKKVALCSSVDISYMDERIQQLICGYVEEKGTILSYQVRALKKHLKECGVITKSRFYELMDGQTHGIARNERQVVLKEAQLQRFFPEDMSEKDMEKLILGLLEEWGRQQEAATTMGEEQ